MDESQSVVSAKQRRIKPLKSGKWVLGFVMAGLLLVTGWYAVRLSAQEPSGAESPAEAAKKFMTYLTLSSDRTTYYPPYSMMAENAATASSFVDQGEVNLRSIVAQKNLEQLETDGVYSLIRVLQQAMYAPNWQAEANTGTDEKTVTVEVTPKSSASRPVVCIQEGRFWRVDIVETFGRWFELNEQQKQARVLDLTGVALSDLALGENGGKRLCQSNLKQLALGVMQYMQDYDELHPPANEWCDVVMPYVKSERLFHCPALGKKQYGYAMNWKLSRKSMGEVDYPSQMVLVYESETLRRNHRGEGQDLAYRHDGGANYAYDDGHVKWHPRDSQQQFQFGRRSR
jgi:prepilin-type processing-associated H-X9-DG protein